MSLLLDTHTWLWFFLQPDRLGAKSLLAIKDAHIKVFLSAASAWEIAIKTRLGKLHLPDDADPERYVPTALASRSMLALPITNEHALRTCALPLHHTDPFDRLLIAQAQIESLTIVTADKRFEQYDVQTLWADS